MFALIDLALLFGLVALILYILVVVAVLPATLGGLSYVFLVIAIVLFVVWLFLRVLGECSGGRYRYGRREPIIV